MRVAIVDDEQPVVHLLERLVRKLPDCEPIGFTAPSDALSWVENEGCDLALVDCRMPHVDGHEFIRRFRAIPGCEEVPLVMISADPSREVRYRKILVAPHYLRHRIRDLIAQEASYGPAGRLVFKLNSLIDNDMVEALYAASDAGVKVDLVLRGICGLRPGVPGMSENIRVRSILGRYLEHSRIYYFANGAGPGQPAYYIGSADLMPRNLDKRVEVLVPVTVPEHREQLDEVLACALAEDTRSWELGPDARWRQVGWDGGDSQAYLYEMARQRARRLVRP